MRLPPPLGFRSVESVRRREDTPTNRRGWAERYLRGRPGAGLPQHEDGFLALRVAVTCGREADLLDDETALLEYPQGRRVTRGGGGDQRTFDDFPEQKV